MHHWKRTPRSAFPAKAGIQFLTNKAREALHWTPAFAGDAVAGFAGKHPQTPPTLWMPRPNP